MISVTRRRPQQVLQRSEAENHVLQVLLERAQDEILAQLVVQVRADQMKHVVEAGLHAMHPFGHVAALVQIEPLVNELQQAVQFGLALGHQRGRHVELVAGQGGQVEILLRAGLQNQLVHQVVAERRAR